MTLKEAEKRIAALEAQVQLLASQIASQGPVMVTAPTSPPSQPTPWWQYPYTVTAGTTSAASGGTVRFINRNDDGPEPTTLPA